MFINDITKCSCSLCGPLSSVHYLLQLLFAIFGLLGLKDLCMSGEIGTPSEVSRLCKCFNNFKCVPTLKDLR